MVWYTRIKGPGDLVSWCLGPRTLSPLNKTRGLRFLFTPKLTRGSGFPIFRNSTVDRYEGELRRPSPRKDQRRSRTVGVPKEPNSVGVRLETETEGKDNGTCLKGGDYFCGRYNVIPRCTRLHWG